MKSKWSVQWRGHFIEVKADEVGYDNSRSLWSIVAEVAEGTGCGLIVVDSNVLNDRNIAELFACALEAVLLFSSSIRLAVHCGEPRRLENLKFFQTVAVNRGLSVGVFADRASALEWLVFD